MACFITKLVIHGLKVLRIKQYFFSTSEIVFNYYNFSIQIDKDASKFIETLVFTLIRKYSSYSKTKK